MKYELHCGDALEWLRSLPAGSVQTCVTSPPYYGLRSYLPGKVRIRMDIQDQMRAELLEELARLGIAPITD